MVTFSPPDNAAAVRPRVLGARARLGLLLGVMLGGGIGVTTSFAQADLPGSWASLANAASPWLVAPFVAGAFQVRRWVAIASGLVACAMEVAGYYVATPLRGFPVADNEIAFWTACAVVGGPAFGWAGRAWRRGTDRMPLVAAGMLPATFLGEAIGAYAIRLHYRGDALVFAGIGVLLLIAFGYQSRMPRAVLGWTLVLTAVATVVYGPVLHATTRFAFGT